MARRPAVRRRSRKSQARPSAPRAQSPPPAKPANGSTPSAAARPRAAPACATCSAARARASPRWRTSACRCRPASPSPPRSARTTTPTTRTIRRTCERRSTPASPTSRASPASTFGDRTNPLLVSVRSGARASMPGMMDTVLNLGLNDDDRRGAGEAIRRPALRLRLLPPLHPDVFQRGARHRASQFRGHPRGPQVARRL